MSLRGNDFTQTVFRNYLSMVASKCNLDLRFSRDGDCRTDGHTVVVPYECLEESKRAQLTACILHEAGHTRYTDFELFGKITRFEKEVFNTIEDNRIETLMCRLYAGAKGFFHRDFEENRKKYLMQIKEGIRKTDLFERFTLLTFFGANRYSYDGMYDVKELYELAVAGIKDCFTGNLGDQLVSEVTLELQGVPYLKSTEETIAMSQRLIAILKKYFSLSNQPSPKDEKGKDKKNEEKGQENTPTDGSNQKKEELCKKKDKGSQSSPQNAKGQSPQDEKPEVGNAGSLEKSFNEARSNHERSEKRTFKTLLDRKVAMGMKERRHSNGSWQIAADKVCRSLENHDLNCGRRICSAAKRESSKLTTALRSYIEAKADTDTDFVCAGSKVCTSRLHRVMTGSMKVFTRVSESPESTNTACCILLDTSGSMGPGPQTWSDGNESNMVKATKATLALYMALQNLTGTENVSTSVIAFPGKSMNREKKNLGNPYAVYLVDHNERMTSKVAGRFGAIDGFGPTPIINALDAASYDLSQVPNVTRRVCFVITDGSFHAQSDTINEIKKLGIEFYGFSLDCEATEMKALLGEKNVEEVTGNSIGPALIRMAKRIFM